MAKCKHFDICHLEATETRPDEDSFCILHSRNEEKDESRFREALSFHHQQSSGTYRHFVFPKSILSLQTWFGNQRSGRRLDFSNARFLGNVNFTGFEFNGGVSFLDSIFEGDTEFRQCIFGGMTDFTRAHFCRNAEFRRAQFQTPVSFMDALFEGDAAFTLATFNHAVFLRTKFWKGVSYSEGIFCEEVHFVNSEVIGHSDFSLVEFRGETNFEFVTFQKGANFTRAHFQMLATFRGNNERRVFFDDAVFKGTKVEKKNALRFINVDLSRGQFHDADVGQMEFIGVLWCRIRRRWGIFEETLISQDERALSLSDIEKLYCQLKQNYEERRDFGRAGDFHMGEKEMRLRNPSTPVDMRIMLALYKFANGYGESFLRPLSGFGLLSLYVTAMSLIGGITDKSSNHLLDVFVPIDWLSALLFALDKGLHLPGEYFVVSGPVRLLQTFIGILGPLFIALFGLAVRNRLRR